MKLLLDSHAFLWFVAGDSKLSDHARQAIEDPGNDCYLSIASVWELAIKHSLGRLRLTPNFAKFMTTQTRYNRIELWSVDFAHVLRAAELPFHNRDPFDRLLACQCLVEIWPIVSADAVFDAYGVERVW